MTSDFTETYLEALDGLRNIDAVLSGARDALVLRDDVETTMSLMDIAKDYSQRVQEMVDRMDDFYHRLEKASREKGSHLDA